MVKTAHDDLVVFCCFAEENKRQELESRGVRVVQVPMLQAAERRHDSLPRGSATWMDVPTCSA